MHTTGINGVEKNMLNKFIHKFIPTLLKIISILL